MQPNISSSAASWCLNPPRRHAHGISQSWTILADQLERLAEIAKDESKFRG